MHVLKTSSSQPQGGPSSGVGPAMHCVGLGDPVMDILVHVSPQLLSSVADHVGGCVPIDAKELAHLLSVTSETTTPTRLPGGSAANVIRGLANLSRGSMRCQFMGMVGRDHTAQEYGRMLAQQGVEPLLVESSSGAPTGSCCCLITPDGQRTMRTCLGAAAELTSAALLPPGWAANLSLLHCEGYCLYRPQLAREAMQAAKKAGAAVSIDLASFELVKACKGPLLQLLQEGLLDLVFANEEEAVALAEELLPDASDDTAASRDLGRPPAAAGAAAGAGAGAEEVEGVQADPRVAVAQQMLLQHAQVSVVSLGARGCIARGRNGKLGVSPAPKVTVMDTIGAGDYFTSGFLYAYLHGCSLGQCAAAGCSAGGEAVQAQGALLSDAAWLRLRAAVAAAVDVNASSREQLAAAAAGSVASAQQQQQQQQKAQPQLAVTAAG